MSAQPPDPGVRLLGPLEVAGNAATELRGPKQRTLLAYLLLHAGEIVPTTKLVDAVWDGEPPPTAPAIVHAYVRKLRDALVDGPATLLTRAPGYLLQLEDDELDVRLFERLAREGEELLRRGDAEAASAQLGEALALWRGEVLPDLPHEGFIAAERTRLDELRLEAISQRIDADLVIGSTTGTLVAELESLVREHPFRERTRRQLMLALYRSGRQADALAHYRDTRELFSNELGLEPSKDLQELERAILSHDASLDLAPQPAETSTARRRLPRRLLAGLAVAVVAVVIVIQLTSGSHSLASTHARAAKILATLDLAQPACCSFGFGAAWGVGHHDDVLRRIDLRTNRVSGHWPIADFQSGVPLSAAGSIWIPSAAGDLVRFDPARLKIEARIHVHGVKLAFAYLNIWETTQSHELVRISLRTNKVLHSLRLASGANNWTDELAVGEGAIWVGVADAATLVRVNPLTNAVVARIKGFGDTDSGMPIAVDQNAVWILRLVDAQETLFRVNPSNNKIVAKIAVGSPNGVAPTGTVATGGGYVWTGNWDASVSKVDPRTNRVVAVYDLPSQPQNVVFNEGSLWVDSYDTSRVWRIDPGA
jgi:DNA-binding SARP family transcriptional activator